MAAITHANLDWNESGTPVSHQFDDVYFSNLNGLEESRYVFIQQNQLVERWSDLSNTRFTIAETGFGTGLNFLAVWQKFVQFRQQNPQAKLQQLHFISFEKYPVSLADLKKAHAAWPELAELANQLHQVYPMALPECHRMVLADGMITLDLWFGDIHDCMPQIANSAQGIVDAWFLDGFAPSKNKDMWNQTLFNGMARLTKAGGTCATFTAAGFVRRGLIEAGFAMKKVKGFGHKREMIAGHLEQRTSPSDAILPRYAADNPQDIAIIGGGIASAALALSLCQRGIDVTLYCEDEQAAQGASGNRQGALYPLLAEPESDLNRFFVPAFIYARQFVQQAAQQLNFDHDLCGVTQLGWNDKAQAKLDKMLLNNYPPELIAPLSAQQVESVLGLTTEMGGVHYPLGGWLCPQQLTQTLLANLQQQGRLTVHYQTHIERLEYQTKVNQWLLHSAEQTFSHATVVIANGHQFNRFTQLQGIAASPVKGQVSHIKTNPTLAKLKTVLCYNGYLTPQNPNNQQHCIGANHDRNQIDIEFDREAQISNSNRLKACLPEQTWPDAVDTSDNQSRQGIRSVTRDHLPYIGNVCQFEAMQQSYQQLDGQKVRSQPELIPAITTYPNLYCFVALGARGLCSAPLLAETLAAQIVGEALPLPQAVLDKLHPARMWLRRMVKGRPLE